MCVRSLFVTQNDPPPQGQYWENVNTFPKPYLILSPDYLLLISTCLLAPGMAYCIPWREGVQSPICLPSQKRKNISGTSSFTPQYFPFTTSLFYSSLSILFSVVPLDLIPPFLKIGLAISGSLSWTQSPFLLCWEIWLNKAWPILWGSSQSSRVLDLLEQRLPD